MELQHQAESHKVRLTLAVIGTFGLYARMDKAEVLEFWDAAACGEELYLPSIDRAGYDAQARQRYALEGALIWDFMVGLKGNGLEVGVGLGADHERLVQLGNKMSGVDLTPRAVEHTRRRLEFAGRKSDVQVADAETLPFPDETFDFVYSWGVIHHSPDTRKAASEILRVLKPGGQLRVMIYHRYSLVGAMLWARYGLLQRKSLTQVYAEKLESPGTKAYTRNEAKALFPGATAFEIQTPLTHGDLLTSGAGQRHQGGLINVMRKIWPRWLFKRLFPNNGLFLMVAARKAA